MEVAGTKRINFVNKSRSKLNANNFDIISDMSVTHVFADQDNLEPFYITDMLELPMIKKWRMIILSSLTWAQNTFVSVPTSLAHIL